MKEIINYKYLREMKTRKENYAQQLRNLFKQENERIMQEVYERELAEMLYLAEYGY